MTTCLGRAWPSSGQYDICNWQWRRENICLLSK